VYDENEVWETWLSDTQFATGECVTDWAVVRPDVSAEAVQGAIAYARRKAAEDGVIFDIKAGKADPLKFYCSKLVWKSYLEGSPGGPDLEADRGLGSLVFGSKWVTPDDLYYSSPVVQEMPVSAGQAVKRGFFYIWSQGQLTFMDPAGRWVEYDPATRSILGEVAEPAGVALPDLEAQAGPETAAPPSVGAAVTVPSAVEVEPVAPPSVGAEVTAPSAVEVEPVAPPDIEAETVPPPVVEPSERKVDVLSVPGEEARPAARCHSTRHRWWQPRARSCR
jgi:hypothetical protein